MNSGFSFRGGLLYHNFTLFEISIKRKEIKITLFENMSHRIVLDTDRMMITQCGRDYHNYSDDKLTCIYFNWAEKHCPDRLQAETDKGRIYIHIDARIKQCIQESGRFGTKCVIPTLFMNLR